MLPSYQIRFYSSKINMFKRMVKSQTATFLHPIFNKTKVVTAVSETGILAASYSIMGRSVWLKISMEGDEINLERNE
jgi:hypothetical protein